MSRISWHRQSQDRKTQRNRKGHNEKNEEQQNKGSEQNLPAMLNLEPVLLQIRAAFAIPPLALQILLLLQLENLGERRFLDVRGQVVFAVEVLAS